MRGLVLTTGHEIADNVAKALSTGFSAPFKLATHVTLADAKSFDFVIGYGVLRGTLDAFRHFDHVNKPWFIVDKGYFGAEHYAGYYRIGYKDSQAPWIEPNYNLCDLLNVQMPPFEKPANGYCLIVPPTAAVSNANRISRHNWVNEAINWADDHGFEALVRDKDCKRKLSDDMDGAACVYTFNSSLAWLGIARGIPAISTHGIVSQWQKGKPERQLDLTAEEARKLVCYMMQNQFTLPEISEGKAWSIINRFASI